MQPKAPFLVNASFAKSIVYTTNAKMIKISQNEQKTEITIRA